MHKTLTWILIADNRHCRIVEHRGTGKGLAHVPEFEFDAAAKPDRDLGSDRPGRAHDRMGPGRHAMEPGTPPTKEESRKFTAMVCEALETAHAGGRFERLILIAPPAALGRLRDALPPALRALVSAELAKDLVHIPTSALGEHLAPILAV